MTTPEMPYVNGSKGLTPKSKPAIQGDSSRAETNPIAPPMHISIRPCRKNSALIVRGSPPTASRMLTRSIERRFVTVPLRPALTDMHEVFVRSCRAHGLQAPKRCTGCHSVVPGFEIAGEVAIDRFGSKALAYLGIRLLIRRIHTAPPTALRSRGIIPAAYSTVR